MRKLPHRFDMKKTIGVLAHVDAGKTTFSEQVLYRTGAIRRAGRVDHRDSFLDLNEVERARGITVFSDQAMFDIGKNRYYWLDTPGHEDFASEMERVLPVLDYAIVLINGAEGVQSHTERVWGLLQDYGVPRLLFVNKMDRQDADFDKCLSEMRRLLSDDICDFRGFDGRTLPDTTVEAIAERDEALLDRLMADDYDYPSWRSALVRLLRAQALFPAFGGAALAGDGIDAFLAAMDAVTDTDYQDHLAEPFSARVYKIRHDAQGVPMAYMKVLSGSVRVKDEVLCANGARKINDLRLCHGAKLSAAAQADAGDIVCVPALRDVRAGDGLGALSDCTHARIEAMLSATVRTAPDVPRARLLQALRMLEAEDPALRVRADAQTGEISVQLMGEIQTEVLAQIVRDRFGLAIEFGAPQILYRETVLSPSVGIGHYEPLRHYAEVWLRLSPLAPGSGIRFVSKCHVDKLALNWQRLIETHVFEREYPGVLTGAPITDVQIELLAGRAHQKHTEGGDFRESTCRAIRNALMYAQCVLLEPVCRFSLRLPAEDYGRVMGDLVRMHADVQHQETMGEWMRVEGVCALRRFYRYPAEFRAATHGRGSAAMRLSHYAPAENAQQVIDAAHYNPRAQDSPDSVFCYHGAGVVIPWNEARSHAHCVDDLPAGAL